MHSELFLRITHDPDAKGRVKEDYYSLERQPHVPGETKLVWSLRKANEERRRIVSVHEDGRIECDCEFYVLGKKICKHIKAMLQDKTRLLPKGG